MSFTLGGDKVYRLGRDDQRILERIEKSKENKEKGISLLELILGFFYWIFRSLLPRKVVIVIERKFKKKGDEMSGSSTKSRKLFFVVLAHVGILLLVGGFAIYLISNNPITKQDFLMLKYVGYVVLAILYSALATIIFGLLTDKS